MSATIGARSTGIFLKLPAPQVVELAALAGFDFVVIDLEHSSLGEQDALALVRQAHFVGLAAVVRLPVVESGLINRLLEEGAAGIQISSVTRVAQVEELMRATRFAPAGTRSVSTAHRQAAYGGIPVADYIADAGRPLTVIQIETATTVDSLDELASAGADVVFIGSVDLEVSARFDHDRVLALHADIAAATGRAGRLLGGVGTSDSDFDYTVVGSDISVLRGALQTATGRRTAHV